jgi:uncharacterized protein (DUF2384 family)
MPETMSYDERAALTRTVLSVLSRWGIEPMDQCRLLGLPAPDAGRRYRRLRMGEALTEGRDIWERVALLLRLENALNQVFPHSALSADLWVTTPRAKLGNRTPLDLMLQGGLEGIRRVERSLDNPYAF